MNLSSHKKTIQVIPSLAHDQSYKAGLLAQDIFTKYEAMISELADHICPKMRLDGETLWVDGHRVDLRGKVLMVKLFKKFFADNQYAIDKKELVYHLYGKSSGCLSERMINSLNQRVIKLVSRTRRRLEHNLPNPKYQNLRWLPYSNHENKWLLYQLR